MEHIKKIIYNLLFFKRSDDIQTNWFIDKKHNAYLCPNFQEKFESVFESFEKYQKIVYDIQGPRDAGTDVIIRQTINDVNKYIGIQIKSEDDLKRKDYLKELKAQYFDTMDKFGHNLLDFYIILCCDKTKNREKIRLIESEFLKRDNLYIIEPNFALTFLHLSPMQVDAMIKSIYGDEDIIYKEGLSIVQDLTPTQRCLLYKLIYKFIYTNSYNVNSINIINDNFINNFYTKIPDYSDEWFFFEDDDESPNYKLRGLSNKERFSYDLNILENRFIDTNSDGSYILCVQSIQPLFVLMMDGNIRYQYTEENLIYYMLDLFGPMKGYESNTLPPYSN
ncbi:hypothetical protein [Bacillus thuringiensis]|uniref:hypothetical protein n=1 Tax=Bacillus thuringiensis TaxID=1428 RepID=UPI000BFA3EC6|nr:hypothetical protein [Bacillus thuringiensis]PEV33306.1 hypothetical protein CN420_00125 [Bacillus thuringiensis]